MTTPASTAIRTMFERYHQGGVESALEVIARDAVFVISPSASTEPDQYEGHPGARRYFAGFEGAIDKVHFDLLSVEEVEPGKALAEIRMSGVGTTTRIAVDQLAAIGVTSREGQVTRIEAYADLDSARAALTQERLP